MKAALLAGLFASLAVSRAVAASREELSAFETRAANLERRLGEAMPDPNQWPALSPVWTKAADDWRRWNEAHEGRLSPDEEELADRVDGRFRRGHAVFSEYRTRGPELQRRLRASAALNDYYEALSQPEREEFKAVYKTFLDLVTRRNAQGWTHGDRGNARVAVQNAAVSAVPGNGLPLGGEGWSIPYSQLEVEMPRLERELADARLRPDFRAQKERELARYKAERRRKFGTCGDWANDVTYVLTHSPLNHFEVGKTEWRLGEYGHASARVRLKRLASPNFVLDPWEHGTPEIKIDRDWLAGNLLYEFQPFPK